MLIPSGRIVSAQVLYHYNIPVSTQRNSIPAEEYQEQFTGHPWQSLLQTSCHINSSVPPITLSFRVEKGQVRDGFGWPLNGWKGKGKMNHIHELTAQFSWHSGFSSLMTLWFILNQRF